LAGAGLKALRTSDKRCIGFSLSREMARTRIIAQSLGDFQISTIWPAAIFLKTNPRLI
jgi:hypothetical protein